MREVLQAPRLPVLLLPELTGGGLAALYGAGVMDPWFQHPSVFLKRVTCSNVF